MPIPLRVRTTVLPGNRIEVSVPELREGETVEVVVIPAATSLPNLSLLEFLDTLPAGPRSYASWEEVERHLQDERAAWDR